MKNFILFLIIIGWSPVKAQVGINTSTPNSATVLDVVSNSKGILIPRLTESERNTSLADNDPTTIPPIGVANTSLSAGTLIFNTTDKRFEFWDGLVWRQLFVATSSIAGNDGVVKINSGNGGLKPEINLSGSGNSYGTPLQILYSTPLVFASSPTTSWPETTVPFPGETSNIYTGSTASTQRWIENKINGQVHIWRLIATVTSSSNSTGSLKASFKNPDSGFEINSISVLPSGSQGLPKVLTFYFYTIADPESLGTGKGYQLFVESDVSCKVIVESLTRVSLFKD
ncbi:hypothetical protein [Empedobacter tilapiae]|uniref:Uncharacterized protein n=1 Tax=Empedobacter tilapiae TaxID=2491114 RepID=A0A4Z1C6X4_9FLAO|nr:hypothetical protein [Empedobacter tilapiae]TGN28021.1 hypothetical protein E4J94_07360 [Empedobacter tilapiae]